MSTVHLMSCRFVNATSRAIGTVIFDIMQLTLLPYMLLILTLDNVDGPGMLISKIVQRVYNGTQIVLLNIDFRLLSME